MPHEERNIKHLIEYSSALLNPKKYLLSILGYKLKSRDIENTTFFDYNHFSGVELGLWSANFFNRKFQISKNALKLFKNPGFEIPRFHGCFEFMLPGNKKILLNLSDNTKETIKSAKAQIRIARELSTVEKPVIVFHPGFLKGENLRKKGIEQLERNIENLLKYAEKINVVLTLENMPYNDHLTFIGSNPEELLEIIKRYNSPFLKITFDWGHVNTYAKKMGKKDNFSYISSVIKYFGSEIIHAHLHYNKSAEKDFINEDTRFRKTQIAIASCFKSLKFVKIGISDQYDRHLPLTKIAKNYVESYQRNILDLIRYSRISEFGYITHEIVPKKVMKLFTLEKYGATEEDYFKGVDFLNQIIHGKKN